MSDMVRIRPTWMIAWVGTARAAASRPYSRVLQNEVKQEKETVPAFPFPDSLPQKDDGWEGGPLPAKNRGD